MTNSNLVDCMTGRSAGFSPLEDASSIGTELTIRITRFLSAAACASQAAGHLRPSGHPGCHQWLTNLYEVAYEGSATIVVPCSVRPHVGEVLIARENDIV